MQELQRRRHPWGGKIPWRKKWQLTPVFLPGKSHGERSLTGYSPWGHKESDTIKVWRSTHILPYTNAPGLQFFYILIKSLGFCHLFCLYTVYMSIHFIWVLGHTHFLFFWILTILYWSTIDWQRCDSSRGTAKWFVYTYTCIYSFSDFPGGLEGKASACNAGDLGSIPGLGISPGGRNGNPLQYSWLENPMDRGAW